MPNNRDPKMDVLHGVQNKNFSFFVFFEFVLTENNNKIKNSLSENDNQIQPFVVWYYIIR